MKKNLNLILIVLVTIVCNSLCSSLSNINEKSKNFEFFLQNLIKKDHIFLKIIYFNEALSIIIKKYIKYTNIEKLNIFETEYVH